MFKIDTLAYGNALKKIPALEKLLFSVISILVALAAKSITVSIIIILVNIGLTLSKAKIPYPVYFKLIILPLGFLLTGIIPIVFSLQNWRPVLDEAGLHMAGDIVVSSIAALSAMYFLALTTPFFDLAGAFTKLRLPKIFVELVLLIYRFIFILMETAVQMTTAQRARLGYVSLKSSYRSTALLFVNLFSSAYHRANEVFTAMIARNYLGEIKLLHKEQKISPIRMGSGLIYFLILTTVAVLGGK